MPQPEPAVHGAGQPVRVDFVSDVVCPWCAIGLKSLLAAAQRIDGLQLELHVQPFELDPELAPGGEDLRQRLMRKYGMSAAQYEASGQAIRERGAALGFTFDLDKRTRSFNTFDAHRLLHWAEEQDAGSQLRLKLALLEAYFTHGLDVSDHAILAQVAAQAAWMAPKPGPCWTATAMPRRCGAIRRAGARPGSARCHRWCSTSNTWFRAVSRWRPSSRRCASSRDWPPERSGAFSRGGRPARLRGRPCP